MKNKFLTFLIVGILGLSTCFLSGCVGGAGGSMNDAMNSVYPKPPHDPKDEPELDENGDIKLDENGNPSFGGSSNFSDYYYGYNLLVKGDKYFAEYDEANRNPLNAMQKTKFTTLLDRQFTVLAQDILYRLEVLYGNGLNNINTEFSGNNILKYDYRLDQNNSNELGYISNYTLTYGATNTSVDAKVMQHKAMSEIKSTKDARKVQELDENSPYYEEKEYLGGYLLDSKGYPNAKIPNLARIESYQQLFNKDFNELTEKKYYEKFKYAMNNGQWAFDKPINLCISNAISGHYTLIKSSEEKHKLISVFYNYYGIYDKLLEWDFYDDIANKILTTENINNFKYFLARITQVSSNNEFFTLINKNEWQFDKQDYLNILNEITDLGFFNCNNEMLQNFTDFENYFKNANDLKKVDKTGKFYASYNNKIIWYLINKVIGGNTIIKNNTVLVNYQNLAIDEINNSKYGLQNEEFFKDYFIAEQNGEQNYTGTLKAWGNNLVELDYYLFKYFPKNGNVYDFNFSSRISHKFRLFKGYNIVLPEVVYSSLNNYFEGSKINEKPASLYPILKKTFMQSGDFDAIKDKDGNETSQQTKTGGVNVDSIILKPKAGSLLKALALKLNVALDTKPNLSPGSIENDYENRYNKNIVVKFQVNMNVVTNGESLFNGIMKPSYEDSYTDEHPYITIDGAGWKPECFEYAVHFEFDDKNGFSETPQFGNFDANFNNQTVWNNPFIYNNDKTALSLNSGTNYVQLNFVNIHCYEKTESADGPILKEIDSNNALVFDFNICPIN